MSNEVRIGEALNNQFNWKFFILCHEYPEIDNYVTNYITVNLGSASIHGLLNGVRTWTRKDRGEVVGIYKEINMTVLQVSHTKACDCHGQCQGCDNKPEIIINLPDKKNSFDEVLSITIGQ